MKSTNLHFYACPGCGGGNLSVLKHSGGTSYDEIKDGELQCPGCHASYPVTNGIPRFVSSDNYAGSFGLQWGRHRKTQLDSYTGLQISRNRLFDVTGWPDDMTGRTILEAGSGAGRFTEILLGTGAEVFSFDFSSAVEANRLNNGNHPYLNLFQGNILHIPLRIESFDNVICLGVIQHTPYPEKAFMSLTRQVRPGGELVVDVYTRRFASLLGWKYLLRPFTKRVNKETLYEIVNAVVPPLVPLSALLRRLAGRAGARLLPIVEYSHLGLPPDLNMEWAVLDTFDMYSPAHDHPQSLATVERWYGEAGFTDVTVRYGPNGVVGQGRKPGPVVIRETDVQ